MEEHFMARTPSLVLALSLAVWLSCNTTNPVTGGTGGSGGSSGTGTAKTFRATLTGAQETPPVNTTGYGTGTFDLNASQTQLTYHITASGLSGPVTMAHFHRGLAGVAGPIVKGLTDTVTESGGQVTADGTWDLTTTDVSDLLSSGIYVNFHTALYTSGEIRGQLIE